MPKPIEEFYQAPLTVDLSGRVTLVTGSARGIGKAIALRFAENGADVVINDVDVSGRRKAAGEIDYQTPYVTAKAGVISLTRIMALELATHGINVNAIAPGSTLTEPTRYIYSDPEKAQRVLPHVPLKRPARAEEISSAALFLTSDDADYITGHTLVVDGGWTAGYIREIDLT